MKRTYKNVLLIMLFTATLVYAENSNKLKAEIKQKENNLIIKISKDNKVVDEIKIPRDNEIIYKIKTGDTLSAIALRYGKSIKKLAKDNNIKNIDLIISGKTLIIK